MQYILNFTGMMVSVFHIFICYFRPKYIIIIFDIIFDVKDLLDQLTDFESGDRITYRN